MKVKIILVFLMFVNLLIAQQKGGVNHYIDGNGHIVTTNTYVPQPIVLPTDLTNIEIERQIKERGQVHEKIMTFKDSLMQEAMKLSYYDKLQINNNSVESLLGELKDDRLNLTEYEYEIPSTEIESRKFDSELNSDWVFNSILIIILLSCLLFVFFKYGK